MSGVRLEGIVKAYGAVQVVHGIDLEVAEKEFVVLVGPSGCGKSTTLRMIAGLEEISDGDLTIDGRHVNRVAPKDRDVAMVFQNYALYPHLNVADNIAFGLRIRKESKDHIAASVDEVGGILGLTPYLERRPADLSGGQRQRVAMGRAIVRQPQVFLFDEPLSNLDAALRVATRIEIAKLKEQMPNSTMIYVTHDQVEAMTLASRIVVLANKGIAQVGSPLELYERPNSEFVAQFIGSPAMNLLPGQVVGTGAQTRVQMADGGMALSDYPTQEADMGMMVNVGVRPEDFVETEDAAIFEGKVDIIEALGEVTLLYFEKQGAADAVIGKLQGIHTDVRGQAVRLTADPAKVHLFANGVSLLYR